MKTKLFILLSALFLTSSVFAEGCGYGPCSCVDPACGDPYSCMDSSSCCAVFGNIGALDSTPAVVSDNDYNPADLYSFNEVPTTRHIIPSYKGENFKGE